MRIMGLDFGDKTIGVAISDALGLTAQGKGIIKRQNLTEDLQSLKEYIKDFDVTKIVVGLPKNMNGSLGIRAEKTIQFVNYLKKRVELPIKLWDERLSTVEAERLLIEADMSRARRKRVIDKMAAAIILQGYLDAETNIKDRSDDNVR